MKFGIFLLVLECLWLLLFIVVSSLAFGLTPETTEGHTMRTDIFAFRSHVFLGATILAALKGSKEFIRWLFPLFLYQIFVDVVNLVQVVVYSGLRNVENLWPLAITVGAYQCFVSLLAFSWFCYILGRVKQWDYPRRLI